MKTLNHTFCVENELGLHARPATLIAKALKKFQSQITFASSTIVVDAKQVMSLLLLEAKKGTQIKVQLIGSDAKEALLELIDVIERLN